MKISNYTFLFKFDNRCYIYNSLSNALIETDSEGYSILSELEKSGKNFDETIVFGKEFSELLKQKHIITDNDTDDFLIYKSYITKMRNQREGMHLTLAPTMECRFKCHYCFEKQKKEGKMSAEVIDSIIKYILKNKYLQNINVTWFGGEPLMAIEQIEEFYDKFIAQWGEKGYSSDIITTGYHINENVINILKKVKISSMQITLDGLKETHNKIKHLDECPDVFNKILDNINLICELAPEISIVIRVNLTTENSHEYVELYKLLYERFGKKRKNISVAPAFVLNRGGCRKEQDKIFFTHATRSKYVLNLPSHNLDSPFLHYPKPFFIECAIRNENAISFDPDGYAYKCWEMIGNEKYAVWKLDNNGSPANINTITLNRQLYGADPLYDPKCSKCKYQPLCSGGCPIQKIENEFEGKNNNLCCLYKGYLDKFMKIHILRKEKGIYNY